MADLKVRQLDDRVTRALRARAALKGVSLEDEVRATLAASVDTRRRAFLRRVQAIREATEPKTARTLEGTRSSRRFRDRRG
jgi:plasmid stability protein